MLFLKKDEEKEANSKLEEVSVAEILEAQREEQLAKEEEEKAKMKARLNQGLPVNAPDSYLNTDDVFSWVSLKKKKRIKSCIHCNKRPWRQRA